MTGKRIDDSLMEQELVNLYTELFNDWARIWCDHNSIQVDTDERWGDFLTNPYLLSPSEAYKVASFRGMICGQETYSYGKELGEDNAMFCQEFASVDKLMQFYKEKMNTDHQSTTIWPFSKVIEKGTGIEFIYNNIAKIGLCGRQGFVPNMQPHILRKELEITSPSFLVFLIGNQQRYIHELDANDIVVYGSRPLYSNQDKVYVEEWDTNLGIPVLWAFHPRHLNWKSVNKDVQAIIIDWINGLIKKG